MLGYLVVDERGAADRLLFALARILQDEGWSLAGAVQVNEEEAPGAKCEMDLHVLSRNKVIRITQNLGSLSTGCRLDPAALETAVGLAEAALEAGPRLCIVNKFGKSEIDGKGFRPLIGSALVQGVPVLTSVNRANLPAFLTFADGMGEELPAEEQSLLSWCRAKAG